MRKQCISWIKSINYSVVFIQELDNPETISETIRSLFPYFPEGLVTDEEVVHRRLLKRYEQAPIGIPHTNMGLFHTSSSLISKPIFCIFNLKHPLTIEGMDRQPVDLSRMLVMLAPSPIQEKTDSFRKDQWSNHHE